MTALPLPQGILGLIPFRHFPPARAVQAIKEKTMFATIQLAGSVSAQGPVVQGHDDGRLTIADGPRQLTGWPIGRTGRALKGALSAVALALLALGGTPAAVQAENLLNVSYDPTRELYREVNEAFAAWWQAQGSFVLLLAINLIQVWSRRRIGNV